MIGSESLLLRLVVGLPLFAALVHGVMVGVLRRAAPRGAVLGLSCGTAFAAFALALAALAQLVRLPAEERVLHDGVSGWIGAGSFSAEFSLRLDPLSSVLLLVVTGVGALVHVYAIGAFDADERDDRGFQRGFALLDLFGFAMGVLVLADNLVLFLLGWEGVALCSSLAVGFWYGDRRNAGNANRIFAVQRVASVALALGAVLLFAATAELGAATVAFAGVEALFTELRAEAQVLPSMAPPAVLTAVAESWPRAELVAACFLFGACAMSAQLPFATLLPAAMRAPVPLATLVHGAVGAAAGIYLLCRLAFLQPDAPLMAALTAWIGAATALFGSLVAAAQRDVRQVVACIAVGQLGLMMLAVGCGGHAAAVFHLGTHAFFGAGLFLSVGAVSLALQDAQDLDAMGGLRSRLRLTHAAFAASALALLGFPYFSGFFSRDQLLLAVWRAEGTPGSGVLFGLAMVSVALTAFAVARLYARMFTGPSRASAAVQHLTHEAPGVVLAPIGLLAVLAVVGGAFGPSDVWIPLEGANSLANYLAPLFASPPSEVGHGTERRVGLLALACTGAGVLLAAWWYRWQPALPERLRAALPWLHVLPERRFFLDEAAAWGIVRPAVFLCERLLFRLLDRTLLDRVAARGGYRAVRRVTESGLRRLEGGRPQSPLLAGVAATVCIVALFVWAGT